jgi:hypothetical protein
MSVKYKKFYTLFVAELIIFRHFFEKNVTGYTYLFFAQTSFIAENIFWREQLKGSFGKIPTHSLTGILALIEIIFYYSFPLVFVIAAFLTFNYPKSKNNRFIFVFITFFLSLIILCAAWFS